MGCCLCCKKKSKDLEEEHDILIQQKRLLELKVYSQGEKQDTESSSLTSTTEQLKFMDYDLYTSLKIIESFFSLTSGDIDIYHELSQKIQSIANLKSQEKLIKYSETRTEVTEIQKRILTAFQDNYKELTEIYLSKYNLAEERIEKIESLLLSSDLLIEERQGVIKEFKEIQNDKKDFTKVLKNFKKLEKISLNLNEIEKQLPALHGDPLFNLKLKELENAFLNLNKASCATFNALENAFGCVNEVEIASIKSNEIVLDTYTGLLSSLCKNLQSLQDLETKKGLISDSQKILDKLIEVDESIKHHVLQSEQNKETAFGRLKRLSRSSSDFAFMSQFSSVSFSTLNKAITPSINLLGQKLQSYISSISAQDSVIVELTEKFSYIEQMIDEIEIKFQEFLSSEVKDLNKSIVFPDAKTKQFLEKTNDQLIQYTESAHSSLIERLEHFLAKFKLAEDLENLKSSLRENQSRDLNKLKSEFQEKLNDLNNKLSALESEKSLLTDSLNTHKSQLQTTKDLSDSLIKAMNEKDLSLTGLKNSVASLQEHIGQVEEDKNKLQDEVDDLQKELRDCKKQLRSKDYELAELKESMEKTE